MKEKKQNKSVLTTVLIVTVLMMALALIITTVMGLPCIEKEGLVADPPTEPPPVPPTEPPTEPPPTLPPPEENPFDRLDFQYEDNYLKLREGESITGVDVSHWQNDIDWEQVKASGVQFAMIRLGYRGYEQGGLNLDTYALLNLEGAIAAGLDVGVYFFSQALTPEEAEEEANFALEHLEPYREHITMPVVFDWEHVSSANARTANMRDPDILTQCTLAFLQTVEASGYRPMVYFNRTQSWKYLNLEEVKQYEFWLAAYTQRMDFPYKVNMWQYTNKGTVPGVVGECDINVYFPDL